MKKVNATALREELKKHFDNPKNQDITLPKAEFIELLKSEGQPHAMLQCYMDSGYYFERKKVYCRK